MKYLSITILSLLVVSTAFAAQVTKEGKKVTTEIKATTPKIATINLTLIKPRDGQDAGTLQWRDFINELKEALKPGDTELQKLDENYAKGRKEIESLQQTRMATPETLQRKAEDLYRLEAELSAKMQKRQSFITEELRKAEDVLDPKIDVILNNLRKAQGWDLVLRNEVIVSIDKNSKFDLTQQVLDILNAEYQKEKKAKAEKAGAARPAQAA